MAGCSRKDDCPLFPQFQMEAALKFWKLLYCDTDDKFETCVRFQMASRGEDVPPTLLPNGEEM